MKVKIATALFGLFTILSVHGVPTAAAKEPNQWESYRRFYCFSQTCRFYPEDPAYATGGMNSWTDERYCAFYDVQEGYWFNDSYISEVCAA